MPAEHVAPRRQGGARAGLRGFVESLLNCGGVIGPRVAGCAEVAHVERVGCGRGGSRRRSERNCPNFQSGFQEAAKLLMAIDLRGFGGFVLYFRESSAPPVAADSAQAADAMVFTVENRVDRGHVEPSSGEVESSIEFVARARAVA